MFKYCLIDTRQCLSNQWIILTGLTYIISSIPDVIFFSSYRGSIADFIILSFSNQYYFLLIILPLLFLFLLKIDWLPSSTILLRNASITTYVIARFSALVISLSAIITFHLSSAAIMAVGSQGLNLPLLTPLVIIIRPFLFSKSTSFPRPSLFVGLS